MKKRPLEFTAASLHIFAMICMVLDHLWATVVPGNEWMTCIGRLAFPIYAFLIVEGYFHTGNVDKYMLRLGLFALVSEIPFNLMYAGQVWYPMHQNVLLTFLIALVLIRWNQRLRQAPLWRQLLRWVLSMFLGLLLGTVTMVDYYGFGIAMVLVFYRFRGRKWWCLLGQILLLWWINGELMGGLVYELDILGRTWYLHQQAFALLALIPIWLYRGQPGYRKPWFQYFRYGFYPAHMLLLALLRNIL